MRVAIILLVIVALLEVWLGGYLLCNLRSVFQEIEALIVLGFGFLTMAVLTVAQVLRR